MGPLYLPHRVVSKPCLDRCPVCGEPPVQPGAVPGPDRVIPTAHREAGQLQSLKAAAHVLVSMLPTARPGRPPTSGSQGKPGPPFCPWTAVQTSWPPGPRLSHSAHMPGLPGWHVQWYRLKPSTTADTHTGAITPAPST